MLKTTVSELQTVLNDVIEPNPCSGMCKDCEYWDAPTAPTTPTEWGRCKIAESQGGVPIQPSALAYADLKYPIIGVVLKCIYKTSHWNG